MVSNILREIERNESGIKIELSLKRLNKGWEKLVNKYLDRYKCFKSFNY